MEHQDANAVELSHIVEPLLPPHDDDDDEDDTADIETPRNAESGDDMAGPNESNSTETNGFLTQRVAPAASDDNDLEQQPPTARNIRRVRVTAPSNLRPGYALEVTCDGGVDTFEVIVPEGGVRKGQEFTAQVPIPVMETWADEAYDFWCNMNVLFDFRFCCQTAFARGIMLAAVMKKMDLDCMGRAGSPQWLRRVSFGVVTIAAIILITTNIRGELSMDHPFAPAKAMIDIMLGFYFLCLGVCVRHAVRKKHRIRGSLLSDACCVIFCGCCSLLQIFRHLKRSGNTPRVFSNPTPAQIVV